MAQPKTTKIISKKHLARLERERRQTLALVIGSIVIVAGRASIDFVWCLECDCLLEL